jgi:hypothetical protein
MARCSQRGLDMEEGKGFLLENGRLSRCCGILTIYCCSGSDFGKVSVSDPKPEPETYHI